MIAPTVKQLMLFGKQYDFVACDDRFTAFIGGIGSGKTYAGAVKTLLWAGRTKGLCMAVAPTYVMMRDSSLRAFLEVAEGAIATYNKAEMRIELAGGGEVLFRSADQPDRLRGANLSAVWLDEASMMPAETWDIVIGRLREGGRAGPCWITTTPKGKNWLYTRKNEMTLFQARTHDNPHLPGEFIRSLEASYTAQFAAQELQGEFIDMQGSLASREWFAIVDAAPAECRYVRAWDFASTERSARSDDPDYTVGARVGVHAGTYYVTHIVRRRSGPGAVEALVRQVAELDGRSIPIVMEQEPGSAGKLFTASLIRALGGWPIEAVSATGDKVTRAMPWLAQAQAGNVKLVRGDWNADLLDEIAAFPIGAHDDQCDAISGAFAKLAAPRKPAGVLAQAAAKGW